MYHCHRHREIHPFCTVILCIFTACFLTPTLQAAAPVELPGASIELVDYRGPATFSIRSPQKFRVEIDVMPHTERGPLTFRIELNQSGREAWPFQNVEVRDWAGRAIPVRRGGIEWQRLFLTVPAESVTYTVQAVEPPDAHVGGVPEKDRQAADCLTGLRATVCKWYCGRRAALSIRFDDSHPTHLSVAIPTLREYGFRGTFMVNPGAFPPGSRQRSDFQDQIAEWQAVAQEGDQELANHTAHHRGADNDVDMEHEIGEASEAIWRLFPKRSKLLPLNLGGGTWWTTTRPLVYYLDKYHLFDVSGSLGMDDTYGNRVAAFREHLGRHIERGGWCRIHFHSIGDGLASREANFRAALDLVKQHQSELWIAGMADIYKYQAERTGATLNLEGKTASQAALKLACSTNSQLFDQPLTLQLRLSESWSADEVVVTDPGGEELALVRQTTPEGDVLQFDARPLAGEFQIRR